MHFTLVGSVRFVVFTSVLLAAIYGLTKTLELPLEVALAPFVLNWVVGFLSVFADSERVFDLTG
jgi:hypothetical protein